MLILKYEGYSLDNDKLLRFNDKIYILPNNKLRSLMLSEVHRVVYMDHLGVMKIKIDLKPLFLWKWMGMNIVSYVERCLEC
jgi:hypothetical protein